MANVLVLGAGLMGPAIAADLLRFDVAARVVVGDFDPRRVAEVVKGEFDLIDFYDPVVKVTSMARTTGYMCSIIVGMLLRGRITTRGAVGIMVSERRSGRCA